MIHRVQIQSGYNKHKLNNVKLVYTLHIQNIQMDETVEFTYTYRLRHVCQLINFILKIDLFLKNQYFTLQFIVIWLFFLNFNTSENNVKAVKVVGYLFYIQKDETTKFTSHMCHEPWLCQVWLIQDEYVMIDWHTLNLIMLLCSVYVLPRVYTISAATGIWSNAWGWSMSYMHGWSYTLYRFAESWNTSYKLWQHPLYFSSRIVFRNPVFVQWRNENWTKTNCAEFLGLAVGELFKKIEALI